MTLYGGLEHKLNMALFGNKEYRTESDKLDNPGRRNFLGTTAKGALAIGLAGTGFLKSEIALAADEADYTLPPGFWLGKTCNNKELIEIFKAMYKGGSVNGDRYGNNTLPQIKRELETNIGFTNEPAYWFTKDYYNYKWQNGGTRGMIDTDRTISKFNINKNSAIYNWAKGINMYFRTWVDSDKNYGSPMETEIYLLKAIFTASGRNENIINDYRILDFPNKERFLQGIMKDLEKQNKTNQLIAAWSSFFLVASVGVNNKNEALIINDTIEIPLRKYIPKIRGPPNYNV